MMRGFRVYFLTILLGFILGIHDGHIALWEDAAAAPVEIFPYRAEMLPISDQQALEKGIHISNQQDLNQLLEDYLS